ncbi:MAG: tetratricopeptide repeat protein [Bdellovibrionia bacterium]
MFLKIAYFIVFSILVSFEARASDLRGNITSQGDTTHVEFFGSKDWDYDLKKQGNEYLLTINPLNAGVIEQFKNFKNQHIRNVKVNSAGPDGKFVVSFATADGIEVFDYLTDQPSRLILDFYQNPNTNTPVAKPANKDNKETSTTQTSALVDKKEVAQRSVASSDAIIIEEGERLLPTRAGIFDGADPNFERFSLKDYEIKEEAIIRSRDNYYIPFPSMRANSESWNEVNYAPAVFQINSEKSHENKMARLLLNLFEKKRYNTYLKTLGWFREKYPNSEYFKVIDYVTTQVHIQMWEELGNNKDYDLAQLEISKVIEKYPENPLSLKLSLKRGYMALNKSDNLSAIQLFERHNNDPIFGKNKLARDLAKLGTAQAFTKLNQYASALETLDDVIKNGSNPAVRVEAQYRRGDVFMQKADAHGNSPDIKKQALKEMIGEYQGAQKKYSKEIQAYPNSVFNIAEAQFWLQDLKTALGSYTEFIKRFPSHNHAPFALTRIGELLEILGADQSKVIGAYLETYFRYGESPSAVVARMRLLSARMKIMKPKELENSIQQIFDLSKKIELPRMDQFSTILVADGLKNRGEYQRAGETLINFYQDNPTTVDKPVFNKRIVSNINNQILAQLSKDDFIGALKIHAKYANNWLKGSNRLDTKFYVGQAFEKAGVEKEAEQHYKNVLNKVYALKGTPQEKELSLLENLPSTDILNLRLAATSTSQKKYKEAYDYLKDIKQPEKLSDAEQIERVDLAVQVLEKKGEDESAIRYLTELLKLWKGQPALVAGPYLQLAQLENRMGKTEAALQSLDKIDQLMADTKVVDKEVHFKSLMMQIELAAANNDAKRLKSSYEKILSSYEKDRPIGSIRYKLGEIYFNQGDLQKAAQIWNEFKSEKSGFWSNLAQEKLKNSKWSEDYKKYIQRIPAMEAGGQ